MSHTIVVEPFHQTSGSIVGLMSLAIRYYRIDQIRRLDSIITCHQPRQLATYILTSLTFFSFIVDCTHVCSRVYASVAGKLAK